jgi:hypothetical protein
MTPFLEGVLSTGITKEGIVIEIIWDQMELGRCQVQMNGSTNDSCLDARSVL